MKKLRFLAFLLVAASTAVFTSCGGDDDDDSALGPTLSLSACSGCVTADATVEPGDSVKFSWTATKGDAKLSTFTITRDDITVQDADGTSWDGVEVSDNSTYVDNATFVMPLTETDYVFKLTATDKDGETASKTITITVETSGGGGTAMTDTQTGAIWHLYGPEHGAWDLVNNVEKMMGDADSDKDMINTSSGSGVTFDPGWEAGSGNGTQYVKDNTFDYDNATVENATSAYSSGTPSGTVSSVAVGDIYIAKLRGGSNYAVIKITTVDPDATKAGDGKIEFSYKK